MSAEASTSLRQRLREVLARCVPQRRAWESSPYGRHITLFLFWSVLLWSMWLRFHAYQGMRFHGYGTGEWLINYEGGFVRRGLVGQIIYFLARSVLHANAAAIVYSVQIGLYLVDGALLTFLSLKKRSSWLPWMLLAPAGLLFVAMDPDGGYRKEELFFLPVLCLAVAVNRQPKARRAWTAAGLALYFCSIFSWEPSVFFLPFMLAFLRAAMPSSRRLIWGVACAAVACTASVAAYHGNAATVIAISDSLPAVGVPKSTGTGAIHSLQDTLSESVRGTFMQGSRHDPKHYFYSFVLSLVPFVASGWTRRHLRFFLVAILWCFPQYIVACDYGRWVHVFITCASIHWLALDAEDSVARTFLPRWCFDIALLVWCSSWSMAHCDDGLRRQPNLLGQLEALTTVR